MARFAWEDQFLLALETGHIQNLVAVLEQQATGHAGTPNAATKRHALRLINARANGSPLSLALQLTEHPSATAQQIGVVLVAYQYRENSTEATRAIYTVADSPHWEVREWAANAAGHVLATHFDEFSRTVWQWVRDPSANVRRAAALAIMYAGQELPAAYADRLLDLVDPLMADEATYVKQNLGPFALGDGLLRRFPEPVLRRLAHWAESNDEQVRWNVARAFSAAVARPFRAEAEPILQLLAADQRKSVQRAVAAARKNLGRGAGA